MPVDKNLPTTLEFADRTRLIYDALTRQLERMRGMQYAYFSKFFLWIAGTAATFLLILFYGNGLALSALPFLVITAGVQASFYLHFVDFSRIHAAAVERRLNKLLGEDVLLGARLEDVYFYPLNTPKISGILPKYPLRFFSAYTTHWLGVWAALFILPLVSGAEGWAQEETRLIPYGIYIALLLLWASANFLYLAWYFWNGTDLRRVEKILEDSYQL